MVLRKPYAFFIKHFKLIHLILAVLCIYSTVQTHKLYTFFSDYIYKTVNVIGQDLVGSLYTGFMTFGPILIIILTITIMVIIIELEEIMGKMVSLEILIINFKEIILTIIEMNLIKMKESHLMKKE